MVTKQKEEYGLFNGRRDADQYVKGYLKGIALISGVGLTVLLGFSSWVAVNINAHDTRLTIIESSRFTTAHGVEIKERVVVNEKNFAVIQEQLKSMNEDIRDMKRILEKYVTR